MLVLPLQFEYTCQSLNTHGLKGLKGVDRERVQLLHNASERVSLSDGVSILIVEVNLRTYSSYDECVEDKSIPQCYDIHGNAMEFPREFLNFKS